MIFRWWNWLLVHLVHSWRLFSYLLVRYIIKTYTFFSYGILSILHLLFTKLLLFSFSFKYVCRYKFDKFIIKYIKNFRPYNIKFVLLMRLEQLKRLNQTFTNIHHILNHHMGYFTIWTFNPMKRAFKCKRIHYIVISKYNYSASTFFLFFNSKWACRKTVWWVLLTA